MERKKFSKFFSFISNFLKVSFLSAIVALGFSYNSSVKAANLFDPPSASQYNKQASDTIPSKYESGWTFYKVANSSVIYAVETSAATKDAIVDVDAIILSGNESSIKVFNSFTAPVPEGEGNMTCNVTTITKELLEKIPDNAELEVENIASVTNNSKDNFKNASNKSKVYLKIDQSSVASLDANIKAWAKAINAQDATVTLKDLGAQYVSYKSGDKLSDIKSKLNIDPTDDTKGTWTVKAGASVISDKGEIPEGTQKLSFSFVAKLVDGKYEYKDTTKDIDIKEEPKEKEAISCKDFNIKANVSGDNPTLKDVVRLLPSGSDTKVVDGSGKTVPGTWKWSDESKSVAKFENTGCEAVFTPTNTAKYPTITKNFKVYNVGKTQTFGDNTFSVSGDGVTSGTVSGKGITWIRESSGGTAAWYGFDNSDGVLPEGATVAVRWIGAKENPEEYAKYVEEAKRLGKPFEENKLWVFEVKAFDSDMNEIKNFGKDEGGNPRKMKFYIESGDDWDADDVIAFFIDTEGGNPELWDVSLETKSINGEEKEFIVANLSHFSVHFVGDEKKAQDVLSDLQKAASDAGTKYKLEHPEASLQDLQKVQFEAMQKAYEQLSDDDKKLVADYAEFLQKSESEDSGNSSDNKVTPQSDSSSSGSSSSTQKSTTSSSPSTTTSSSKIKTGSDVSNLMFLMQYVFGASLGTAIISRRKKFD